ncbi:MAG: DUF2860 family protein [Gammaproteobacteria bacterium]
MCNKFLTEAPESKGAYTTTLLGELRYTLANQSTQLFVGQLFTDYIRYDVTNVLGARRKFNGIGVIGVSYVFAGFVTRVWEDPYVVDEDRVETDRKQGGWRVSWDSFFDTQFGFQYTLRNIELNEKSGTTQLSLSAQDAQLLDRNGDLHEYQLFYNWKLSENHSLTPEFRYDWSDTEGLTMNAKRFGLKIMYTYIAKEIGVVLISSAGFTGADYEAENPIYNKTRNDDRYGLDLTYLQFGLFSKYKSQIALVTNAYYFLEDSNINFYDQEIFGINLSLLFRF